MRILLKAHALALFTEACAAVELRNNEDLINSLDGGNIINMITAHYGMTLLHLAAGTNNLPAARILIERGALFLLDKQNRMPSIVAADAEADEDLCDYLAEKEELALLYAAATRTVGHATAERRRSRSNRERAGAESDLHPVADIDRGVVVPGRGVRRD